jgi:acid phosphatase type 7
MPVALLGALVLVLPASCGGGKLEAASARGVRVWAVGDGGNGTHEAKRLAAQIAKDRPKRVIYLGDVYEHGTADDFRARFATVYGALAARMEPTPGNHDWPAHATGYDPYWRNVKQRRVPHHYAFSLGGWRLLSLNSETPGDSAQLAFARRELARAKGNCVIAFWHRPRIDAGLHRDEAPAVDPLWRVVKGRAALVLSGHDHNLQRFRPIGGTEQLVVGAGGRERYNVDEGDSRLAWSDDRVDGALRMRLAPGIARLSFVAASGEVLDRTTVRCRRS